MKIDFPESLLKKLKELPAEPGVYFHKDKNGNIIYVGKAAILKNRVRQYFQAYDRKDPKTQALVREIADTDWIKVESEIDALFLESEMIKRYKPKWNILLMDDKSATYVRIDMKSEVPYVSFTRNPDDDGADYFGPYYGQATILRALRALRRVFPYYTKPYNGKKTLDTDLGLTPGIEIEKATPAEYKQDLKQLESYLRGNRKAIIKEVEKNMKSAAAANDFERAASLRNELFGLKGLSTKIIFSDREFLDISSDAALSTLQKMLQLNQIPKRIEGYDISHQSGKDVVGSMVTFINGVAERREYKRFKLHTQKNDDVHSLEEVIIRRLRHLNTWGKPDLIILDGGVPQISIIKPLLDPCKIPVIARDKSGDHSKNAAVKIVIPEGEDFELVSLPHDSHVAKLIARIDEESHRFAIQYHRLLKSKRI